MTIVWILLWIIGIIIIIKDNKTESSRWLSLTAILSGLGAFSVVFEEDIITYFINIGAGINTVMNLHTIQAIMTTIVHYFAPYSMLLFGLTFADLVPKNKKKIIYLILLIPPILSFILLPVKSNSLKTPEEVMLYYRQLSIWIIPYMSGGFLLPFYSYIKEKSYVMKRYKLLTTIIVTPAFGYSIVSNIILRALGLENNWRYFIFLIPVTFILFLYFSYKYGVFGVRLRFDRYKFAFENILEFVSDSLITLDLRLNVIEYNKQFLNNFSDKNVKYKNFDEIINFSKLASYKEELSNIINASRYNKTEIIEIYIENKNENRYFQVQANPINQKDEYYGTVLVFKDITLYKKNIELAKENQLQLIEKERLLSLNQLMSGVAHNLKTPIMSSAGGINIIKRDTKKIYEYIEKYPEGINDVKAAMDEINDWEGRIIEYLKYMSNVINSVKEQIKDNGEVSDESFSIEKFIEKITSFMTYECVKSKRGFVKELNMDLSARIRGNINSLIQVVNNLITNAIEASNEGSEIILGAAKKDDSVILYVKNFGEEIPESIKNKIFNKMVTTKGRNGTGLGLYISKAIVKGNLNGEIYFKSNKKETTFYIKMPLIKGDNNG